MSVKEEEEMTWKTRDGTVLRIVDMSTEHLKNCQKFIKRTIDELEDAAVALTCFSGDMATYYADRTLFDIQDQISVLETKALTMGAEYARRV